VLSGPAQKLFAGPRFAIPPLAECGPVLRRRLRAMVDLPFERVITTHQG
jgi:hypothetical protein